MKASAVDEFIGSQMRSLRVKANISQTDLASALNITFQQVQKFEKGMSKLSATQLFMVAQHLNAPLDKFQPATCRASAKQPGIISEAEQAIQLADTKEGVTLLREFLKLNGADRKRLISIARILHRVSE